MQNAQKVQIIPNVSFLRTLRNSGYNNYTAIADIVDNSLDTNVNSKNIRISFETSSTGDYPFKFIKINDDGIGMTYDTLVEAMKLGSNTGKSRRDDLGSYGTGMKSASLSIGRKLTIRTKSITDKFYVCEFDLDEILSSGNFEIPIYEGSEEEYTSFKKEIGSDHGTSIIITKLDKVDNKNITQFSTKLIKDLALFYKYFIEEKKINIYINDEVIRPYDPMLRFPEGKYSTRLSTYNQTFMFNDKEIVYNAYYIHKTDDKFINRNPSSSGLYIYRNKRLVGSGLDLGIIGKHGDGYLNGLRIELFVDGESDNLFGSTFMKMIHEKDKNEINQSFRDICKKNLQQYISTVRNLEKIGVRTNGVEEEVKDEFKTIIDNINQNKLVNIKKVGKNNKVEEPKEKKPVVNKGKNKFSPRKREDSFTDWKFQSFGENGVLFKTTIENGKHIIHMNTDHIFWNNFLKDATNDTKGILTRFFVSMAISLDTIGYYDDTEKEVLIQEYLIETSSNLRKLITV